MYSYALFPYFIEKKPYFCMTIMLYFLGKEICVCMLYYVKYFFWEIILENICIVCIGKIFIMLDLAPKEIAEGLDSFAKV